MIVAKTETLWADSSGSDSIIPLMVFKPLVSVACPAAQKYSIIASDAEKERKFSRKKNETLSAPILTEWLTTACLQDQQVHHHHQPLLYTKKVCNSKCMQKKGKNKKKASG